MKNWITFAARLTLMITCLALLVSCGDSTRTPGILEPTPSTESTSTAEPSEAAPTPTLEQPDLLSICIGQEPSSLFIYADTSPGARAVYQAIYDGPVDTRQYVAVPVILEQIPNLDNGGIRYEAVEVKAGDVFIGSNGAWQTLAAGVSYRPSGCHSADCAITYSGSDPASIDRLVFRYSIKQSLTWSDGMALTADDSVYSYEIARQLYPAVQPDLIQITQSYQAVDSITIEWRSVPGFQGGNPAAYFFHPLPRHLWGATAAADLYTSETVNRLPIGWGPYVIQEWVAGDHITLQKNSNYFRLSEGLPNFEHLVFRFVDGSQAGIDALLTGECDLIDETVHVEDLSDETAALVSDEKAALFSSSETGWEQLTFGILPADPARPAPFQDPTVRQAAAYCIDRQAIAELIPGAQVMSSYISPSNPLYNDEVETYSLDLQNAGELLDAAGWTDADGDPSTARTNTAGQVLSITYLVPDEPLRGAVGQAIRDGLVSCGFQVDLQVLLWDELLAAGPEGPVFGRQFDLAQFGWASSAVPPCNLYLTSEIPGPYPDYAKGWGGANAGGFSSEAFDAACRLAQESLPGTESYVQAHSQAQTLFAESLPVLPLFSYSSFALARPDLCGMAPAAGTSLLWDLEAIQYGWACQP